MNEHKFCFILCTNNEYFLEECLFYINRLEVPEGYELDLLTIREAECMTEGYQAAMEASDAKYKIYMHQDVFIINRHFLFDVLKVFEQDEAIGMLGVIGSLSLPEDGVMWNNEKRCGKYYFCNLLKAGLHIFPEEIPGDWNEVEAIDGCLMVTAVDLPWRTDLFRGWDFYDVSQSMEFRKAGYKVIVPKQEKPWIIHDDGFLNMGNYQDWNTVFLEEYGDMMGK